VDYEDAQNYFKRLATFICDENKPFQKLNANLYYPGDGESQGRYLTKNEIYKICVLRSEQLVPLAAAAQRNGGSPNSLNVGELFNDSQVELNTAKGVIYLYSMTKTLKEWKVALEKAKKLIDELEGKKASSEEDEVLSSFSNSSS